MQPSLASQVPLPAAGERVGRYEILAPVAEGGMAGVFAVKLASIAGFEKLLAMKVLLPHLRKDRQFVDMFLDEARIAAAVHHPNVVQVFDLGEHEGTPFLVMEFLRGQTLHRVLKRSSALGAPPFGAGLVLHVLARAAEGLHAAHETTDDQGRPLGIVHRDVSPQNIHVGYDGVVKMLDFGIAAARGRLTETRSGEVKGKMQYLAPEQLRREVALDRRVDVWALGVVAWEILAGDALFRGPDDATTLYRVMNHDAAPIGSRAPGLPYHAAETIDRCLRRTRLERPSTCLELAAALDDGARALGCRGASDVIAAVDALFRNDRAAEDEHLSRAGRLGSGRLVSGIEARALGADGPATTVSEVRSSVTSRARASRRTALGALLIVAVVATAAAAWAWSTTPWSVGPEEIAASTPAPDTATPTTTVDESASATPASAAGEPAITVQIDPRARLVLVDGQRSDVRPVQVALGDDGRAVVELVSPTGDVVRHEVTRASDGSLLRLSDEPTARSRPPRPSMRRTAMQTGAMDDDESSPLLGDPY